MSENTMGATADVREETAGVRQGAGQERQSYDRRRKQDFETYWSYVCPECWHALPECTCDVDFPWNLLMIDRDIQEQVRILNEKGYATQYCCASHDPHDNVYIAFADAYLWRVGVEWPKGFQSVKSTRIVQAKYGTLAQRRRMSEKEFLTKREEFLAELLRWCKELPARADWDEIDW